MAQAGTGEARPVLGFFDYGMGTAARSRADVDAPAAVVRWAQAVRGDARCDGLHVLGDHLVAALEQRPALAECTSASAARGESPVTNSGERRVCSTIACT